METVSVERFFKWFRSYNLRVLPSEITLFLLGVLAVVLTIKKTRFSDKIISGILATPYYDIRHNASERLRFLGGTVYARYNQHK